MKTIPASITEKIDCLKNCGYFKVLDESSLHKIARVTRLNIYEPGEAICWQGEECSGLYSIKAGSVKLFKLSAKGREYIIRVLEEGETFNEVPVFDQGLNPVNVAALDECQIWIVPVEIIRQVMSEQPEMAAEVILSLTKNLRMLVEKVEELSFYQVTNRLARLIGELPLESSQNAAGLRITQDQMAARLGTVREVVARSLRELERSGAIRVERRQIQIVNDHLLRSWAQEPN
jgi:CRP/FNR family transcriptional regulator